MSVAAKKTVVRTLVEEGTAKVSEVCKALGLARSIFYATSQRSSESLVVERKVVSLSKDNPRYGYRRFTALLRRDGQKVNEKRVQAARCRHGLQVRKKLRRTKRGEENEAKRLSASERNQVWSWDFVHDQTEWGSSFRILSVIDEFLNREIFYSLAEAEIMLNCWRKEYNEVCIHSSLAYPLDKFAN